VREGKSLFWFYFSRNL